MVTAVKRCQRDSVWGEHHQRQP